ncbi:hypothetical protein PITCH_A360016 [uncultured Desulfobacterium sp.]|uniref:Uncharacterized protein n=1 Tax=uncultured Desulfobacterium sp. TaxID=201089 RepID=A0A445MZV8_9BACT|nr:hypothetical protein PITCH_A360016 [uncultured Desulfobacterium sp.]
MINKEKTENFPPYNMEINKLQFQITKGLTSIAHICISNDFLAFIRNIS